MGVSKNNGPFFGSPDNKDHGVFGHSRAPIVMETVIP